MTRKARFKVVIPTRYGSTRLPGKALRMLAGKSLVQHVHEAALRSGADEVLVATDDERIARHAEGFGARVVMTSAEHESGTDRIAEVARAERFPSDTIVVNLQGDEPLVDPALLARVAVALDGHEQAGIATLATPIRTARDAFDPHVVKVVLSRGGLGALLQSRAHSVAP